MAFTFFCDSDSVMEVVVYSTFFQGIVSPVWFTYTRSCIKALWSDVSYYSSVVTTPCKEVEIIYYINSSEIPCDLLRALAPKCDMCNMLFLHVTYQI